MGKRSEFPKRVKLRALDRANGACEECGKDLVLGGVEFDHDLPCEFGGANTLDNCKVLCVACHRAKTSRRDAPAIAKARRLRAKHAGIKTGKQALPGSKGTRFKRTIDGRVIDRRTGEEL